MARTPEQPDDDNPNDDKHDETSAFDDEGLMAFPEVSRRTQAIVFVGLVAIAGGGLLLAQESNSPSRPHVNAIVTSASGWPFIAVETERGELLTVTRGTRVEAFCYDLHANNNFGGYRFVIDEGLYNGKVAQTDRGHLYTTGDPWPPAGMSRSGDPFNNLPNC